MNQDTFGLWIWYVPNCIKYCQSWVRERTEIRHKTTKTKLGLGPPNPSELDAFWDTNFFFSRSWTINDLRYCNPRAISVSRRLEILTNMNFQGWTYLQMSMYLLGAQESWSEFYYQPVGKPLRDRVAIFQGRRILSWPQTSSSRLVLFAEFIIKPQRIFEEVVAFLFFRIKASLPDCNTRMVFTATLIMFKKICDEMYRLALPGRSHLASLNDAYRYPHSLCKL
jgi:hypothetical protein